MRNEINNRTRGCTSAQVIQVIQTKSVIGEGTEENPVRYKNQYWDFDGNLLAEFDTQNEKEKNY